MRFSLVILVAIATPLKLFAAAPPPVKYTYRKVHDPDGIGKFYLGREIAWVMGYQGAEWLDRPERIKEEGTDKLLKALPLKPGMAVADLGAGSGYYTFPIAEKVGPKGKVYAVDIQKEMLDLIKRRMKTRGVSNIEPVRGTITDPKLPEGQVDLILMVDVYHEFSHPYEMTAALVKALKSGGLLVFVEFRMEDPAVPIKLVHKMSQKQVIKEMRPHPVRYVKTLDMLPWQHVMLFRKD